MLAFEFAKNKPLDVLCLGAHCDDIEIGAGGTILKLLEEGRVGKLYWIVFTSNETRKQEAVNSAEAFLRGVEEKKIQVHSFRDGFLPYQAQDIKELLETVKKEFSPDVIFTHYRNDRHQDHRVVSDLTWNTWRNNLILEYEIPKYDGDLGTPNCYIPLKPDVLAKRNKILLEAFVSQQAKHWFDEATFNALARLRGMESASAFAEAFYARKITL